MLLSTLQHEVSKPHLGRIELACRVGVADIRAHVMQVVKELAKNAEVPGFRKGKAPLRRVQAHYIKDVRARALARLVESIQEAVGEQVGKKYRILGSPKPEYDKDARLDEVASFEVQLAYDIDPMSDDFLAPKGLVNAPEERIRVSRLGVSYRRTESGSSLGA
jgi:FKBP-type peptidyl-prolyl cis-trans isomerase (trigger factor)